MRTHTIALFVFDGFQLLDVTGPAAVLGAANSASEGWTYEVEVVSPAGGLVKSSCGVSLQTRASARIGFLPPHAQHRQREKDTTSLNCWNRSGYLV